VTILFPKVGFDSFEPTKQTAKALKSGMSWLTLSRTIPTAIFTILASYALWESHAPYKKRQRLRQTVVFIFFVSRLLTDHRAIMTRFLAISKPGEFLEILMR
jgi:hypothetical protein